MNSNNQSGSSKLKTPKLQDSSKTPSAIKSSSKNETPASSRRYGFSRIPAKSAEMPSKPKLGLTTSTPSNKTPNTITKEIPSKMSQATSMFTSGILKIFKPTDTSKPIQQTLGRSKSNLSNKNITERTPVKRSGSASRVLQRDHLRNSNIRNKNVQEDNRLDRNNFSRRPLNKKPGQSYNARSTYTTTPKTSKLQPNEKTEPVVKSIRTPIRGLPASMSTALTLQNSITPNSQPAITENLTAPALEPSKLQSEDNPLPDVIILSKPIETLPQHQAVESLQLPIESLSQDCHPRFEEFELPITPISTSSESLPPELRPSSSSSLDSGFEISQHTPMWKRVLNKYQNKQLSPEQTLVKVSNSKEAHEHLSILLKQISIAEKVVRQYNILEYDKAEAENIYLDEQLKKKDKKIAELKKTVDRLEFELKSAKAMFNSEKNLIMNDQRPYFIDWDNMITLFETVDKMRSEYRETTKSNIF